MWIFRLALLLTITVNSAMAASVFDLDDVSIDGTFSEEEMAA